MRSYLKKLLKCFKTLFRKLTRPYSQRTRYKPLNESKKPFSESFPSSVKVEPPKKLLNPQPSVPTEIDTSQKTSKYPSISEPELLIDSPFEDKFKRGVTGSSPISVQGKNIDRFTPQPLTPRHKTQFLDKINQKRPYIKCPTNELERIANAEWNNPKILNEIHHELQFRSRKKATDLLIRVSERLIKLKGTKIFPWPTTDAPGRVGQGIPEDTFPNSEGLLRRYGYKVGLNGLPESKRRQILDDIFLHSLPSMDNVSYLNEWGQIGTDKRLKKLAESIAAFTRNAKRRNKGDFDKAIQDWEADLAYLKRTYYDERFNFNWPQTGISRS
jgi:hypothetical protein